jgi:hypothetical protein
MRSQRISAPNATYRPAPLPFEGYAAFVRESKLDHTFIVHSEVYQDDHRYFEYCFEHESRLPGGITGGSACIAPGPSWPFRVVSFRLRRE